MPRTRSNDPLGVSDEPAVVSDPKRIDEITTEFKSRLAYLERNLITVREFAGDPLEFNRSLRRLGSAVAGKRGTSSMRKRLHFELELLVSEFAKRAAARRAGVEGAKVLPVDVEEAVQEVVRKIKPRRGRPGDHILVYHVEALMALIQEITGKPVLALRHKNSDYDPHIAGMARDVIVPFFQRIDPSISETRLADIVEKARRKYAGKRMRFTDFFPTYGGSFDPETGMPVAGPGYRIEKLEPNIPIYSR